MGSTSADLINLTRILVDQIPQQSDRKTLEPTITGLLNSRSRDESKDGFLERVSNDLINLLGFESVETISDVITKLSDGLPSDPQYHRSSGETEQDLNSVTPINQSKSDSTSQTFLGDEEPLHPHIFSSVAQQSSQPMTSSTGSKFVLPIGTTRSFHESYEEIVIPPNQKIPMRSNERLIQISELDPICKRSFSGYKTLNRLQSAVFSTAYRTNENMLVCAPTGAGKTDVAMLAVLRAISQYGGLNLEKPVKGLRNNFKVIYVAPMKALASEVVRKMEKRLGWLGMVVKELTGDMQLTREEIDKTHFIVTTPEKWDVVTRKSSGEEDLVSRVKLLIIDEVHLLHEERGAVIETIVARTLRQVESSQSLIRIVGLSATLPNYLDVAEFLRVNQLQGLFYFDSSFRPVPLEQHFIGVKGKPNSMKSRTNLDIATFEKVSELVKEGHQVMVFVHARKETVKTAEMLRERAKEEGLSELFDPSENPRYDSFTRDLSGSKNKQMKDLAKDGFGIHHAGMLRSDRNISERLFEAGVTRLLCCTATLAWGVNLPAYAVIIKGTQIYDSSKGSFVDLGILDVLQIFGRAGRPQYEDHGVGYICTTHDSLDHYVAAITQQHPIESQFVAGMVDSLNAEIALGTVRSVDEGVRWIGWTYLFVRMRKNPLVYGITISDVEDDPFLGSRRHTLIEVAAKKLQKIGMVIFDETTGSLQSTELGKIASKFYIKNASIEIFNGIFRSKMSEADILAMISESVEFDQIKVRESEAEELEQLEKEAPCQVKGGPTSTPGKVNILLQAYISRLHVEDFALISDTAYVAQNAARIARALVDIGVWKKLADTARVMIEMAKCIDKQIWPFMHPLIQSNLSDKLVYDLDQRAGDIEIEELVEMKASEIGKLCRLNDRLGSVILRAAKQFPRLAISYTLQPLSSDLLRVRIHLEHKFEWSSQIHGQGEAFWIWLEDGNQRDIFRITKIYLRSSAPKIDVDLILSLDSQPLLDYFAIRVISDQWLGAENLKEVSLDGLVLCPTSPPPPPTPLLDLPLLSTTRLEQLKDKLHIIGLPDHLHPVETQCFHTVYHTPHDCLICAPERSVSRNLTLLAIGRALRLEISEEKNIFVVVPRVEMVKMYTKFLGDAFKMFPVKVNSAFDNSRSVSQRLSESQITIITPKFGLALPEKVERIKKVLTILIDVHDLSEEYELFIERIINEWHESRLIAFSSSLLDPRSLASWLGIEPRRIYNFRLNSRSTPISVDFQAIKTPYSSTQWKSMVLPVWTAIQGSEKRSVMIFVQSRGVCEGLAKSLIQYSASTITQNGSGAVDESLSEYYIRQFKDERVADLLRHRMMILEDNRMTKQEVELTIDLFRRRAIKVLIMTRESCWRISDERLRSEIVILMGTQYSSTTTVEVKNQELRSHLVKRIELPELVQIQGFVGEIEERKEETLLTGNDGEYEKKFVVMSEDESLKVYETFLRKGLSLESKIEIRSSSTMDRIFKQIFTMKLVDNQGVEGIITNHTFDRTDLMGIFYQKFLFQRIQCNPLFYGIDIRENSKADNIVEEEEEDDDDQKQEERIKFRGLRVSKVIDIWIEQLLFKALISAKNDEGLDPSKKKYGLTKLGENLLKERITIGKLEETILKVRQKFFGDGKLEKFENEGKKGEEMISKSGKEFMDSLKLKSYVGGEEEGKRFEELLEEARVVYKRLTRRLKDRIGDFPSDPKDADHRDEGKNKSREEVLKKEENGDDLKTLRERWIKRLVIFSFEDDETRPKLQIIITSNIINENSNLNGKKNHRKSSRSGKDQGGATGADNSKIVRVFKNLIDDEIGELVVQLIRTI